MNRASHRRHYEDRGRETGTPAPLVRKCPVSTSTVDFNAKGFEANDDYLKLWMLMVCREIDMSASPDPGLGGLREDWHFQATHTFGYGVVPRLDEHLGDAGLRRHFLRLCQQVAAGLDGFGAEIPLVEANRFGVGGEEGAFVIPVPTAAVREINQEVTGLLT